jgi:hypothetical protein
MKQSFIVVQALFSAMPILIFFQFLFSLVFLVSTAALLFGFFWTLVATCVLVPVLAATFTIGLFLWGIGFSTFFIARTGFDGLCMINAAFEAERRGPVPTEASEGSPPAETAESSPLSFAASWANVDGQFIKEEESGISQTVPAHPDPGSDLDALEP